MAILTAKQRKAAPVDLTLAYLNNYYAEWRYTKVLTLEKLIKNRCEFYSAFNIDLLVKIAKKTSYCIQLLFITTVGKLIPMDQLSDFIYQVII